MTPEQATLALHEGHGATVAARVPRPAAPRLEAGVVPRPRIVRALAGADVPLVLITAPAGYGKTTLLADWAARDGRRFEWSSGEDDPGAPGHLLDEAFRGGPTVVVVDDADRLPATGAAASLADRARRLPPGSTLALASRRRLALPLGRLRVQRLALEIGSRELAMTRLEAAMLLDGAGLRLGGEEVDRLLERTEGWPAALYLSAIAIREQQSGAEAIRRFDGTDRLVADYLRTEVLAGLSDDQVDFLCRTSILDRLTGPLCDAVLDARGSDAVLERLAHADVLVEPVDRSGSELRRHPLLTDLLRAELARREPEAVALLHRRASDWHARRGAIAAAAGHAAAGGDLAHAGRVLWSLSPGRAGSGRTAEITPWLERFAERELASDPHLALTAAAYHLVEGRRDESARWTETAGRCALVPSTQAAVTLLRACVARGGIARMGEQAARARGLMAPADPWRSACRLLEGVAHHLTGRTDEARATLDEGASGRSGETPLVEALCAAQLAMLHDEHGEADEAARRLGDARERMEAVAQSTPLRALVLAAGAALDADGGDVGRARRDASEAVLLVARLNGFAPWYLAEAQIWAARALIRLSDAVAARTLLSGAARLQPQLQDAPVLWGWLHEGWERADAFAAGVTGDGPALTTAELRVLRFLPSHMSFREIGVRLHVSPNTVKTHALSVYRKLDVTCRSDAVAQGLRVGLIDR